MISIQLNHVASAEAERIDGVSYVTLRFPRGDRVVIHTRSFTQAIAIANAINAEEEARSPGWENVR